MQVGGYRQDTLKITARNAKLSKKLDDVTLYRGVLVYILIVSSITAKYAKEQVLKIKKCF